MSESKHTPGPLKVAVSEDWPFDIETRTANGEVVFRTRLPCHSTSDKTAKDAISCKNFDRDERDACAEANKRAIADEAVRAAAPELMVALDRANSLLAELTFSEWIPKSDIPSIDIRQRINAAHVIASSAIAKATGQS